MIIWTPELKAEVCELWKKHTATQISGILAARGLHFTRNSIIGLVHRAGLKGHDKILEHPLSRPQRRPKSVGKPRPKLRIVNGGGKSNLRVAWSTQTDMPDLRCVEVDPLHLRFEQLVSDSCRYVYGDGVPFTFCGHRQQEGSSYCPHHKMLCHELPWKRRTRGVAA
jgi:GcrA cell cycle regulator